jgi:hypothetical protein
MVNIVYAYTRKQAVEDGEQVDVSTTAAEAGIRFPVFLTRRVFDAYVTVPPNVSCQDEAGRLWDIVSMLCFAIKSGRSDGNHIEYSLYVRNDNRRPKLVKLVAVCCAHDMDAPEPAITVMMPGEDFPAGIVHDDSGLAARHFNRRWRVACPFDGGMPGLTR